MSAEQRAVKKRISGETPELEMMVSRVHCDIWYVKNQSFWLDIQILVRTAFELLRNRNVY